METVTPTDSPPGTTSNPKAVKVSSRGFVGTIVRVGGSDRAASQHDAPSVIERPTTTQRLPVFFEGNWTIVGPFHGVSSFRLALNVYADDSFNNPFTSAPQVLIKLSDVAHNAPMNLNELKKKN